MKRKRKDWARVYNLLDSQCEPDDMSGFWFVLDPLRDPVAWKALEHYADITPNIAQRQALLRWLTEHPCPGEPQAEQLEMGL